MALAAHLPVTSDPAPWARVADQPEPRAEPHRAPSPGHRALAALWIGALLTATEPEPREPEGQTLRPAQGPRGQA